MGQYYEGINPYKQWSNVQSASGKAGLHIQCSQTDKMGKKSTLILTFSYFKCSFQTRVKSETIQVRVEVEDVQQMLLGR